MLFFFSWLLSDPTKSFQKDKTARKSKFEAKGVNFVKMSLKEIMIVSDRGKVRC